MRILGALRRLDERVLPRLRQSGESPEAFLRRVAKTPVIKAPGLLEVQAALREHLALLDEERRQR